MAADLWGLLTVYLWIQLRDDGAVDGFYDRYWEAMIAEAPLTITQIEDYARIAKTPRSIREWPEELLDQALRVGTVVATGRRGNGSRQIIPSLEWHDLALRDWPGGLDGRKHAFPSGSEDVGAGAYFYRDVAFTQASVRTAFPANLPASAAYSGPPVPKLYKKIFATDPYRERQAVEELEREGNKLPGKHAIARKLAEIWEREDRGPANWRSFAAERRPSRRTSKP